MSSDKFGVVCRRSRSGRFAKIVESLGMLLYSPHQMTAHYPL